MTRNISRLHQNSRALNTSGQFSKHKTRRHTWIVFRVLLFLAKAACPCMDAHRTTQPDHNRLLCASVSSAAPEQAAQHSYRFTRYQNSPPGRVGSLPPDSAVNVNIRSIFGSHRASPLRCLIPYQRAMPVTIIHTSGKHEGRRKVGGHFNVQLCVSQKPKTSVFNFFFPTH